jgi:hypothetical protein
MNLLRIWAVRPVEQPEDQPRGRKSHQFLVAFAALGKMHDLVYRWLSMLVRHKFSLSAEDLRYGIRLKNAYMPIQLRRAS